MSLLKRLLGGDHLSKYEKEQKRRYKQYVKLGTTTTIVSSKPEPEIYQDYLTRLKSLRRSKKKAFNKQNKREQQDDIFKDPTPIGNLSPAPAVLDAVNRNVSFKNIPETCLNDLKELEALNLKANDQNKQNIQLGNNSTHYKQEEIYEGIYENQDIAAENTQPLDKKFSYGNQEHFLDQLDEVIRFRQTKQRASQDNLKTTTQQQNQKPSNSNSVARQKRGGSESPIYEYISDQENEGNWKTNEYQVKGTANHENIHMPVYSNNLVLEEDLIGAPVVKPRNKHVQRNSLGSPEFRGKFIEGNGDDQREEQEEEKHIRQIRARYDSGATYPSENEEQYWGTPPDNFYARSDSFVTTQSEDSFFDCISDDGDIYDDGEKKIMKQISSHYYGSKKMSPDGPVMNYRNTDSDATFDESLEPPKYSSLIQKQEPTYENQEELLTDENSNNMQDDSIEPDSLEANLDFNGKDDQSTHVYTNWAETVRIRERDFASDEESKEKVREYEEAQRHDEALILDENDSSSTPIKTFKGDPEFLRLHQKPKASRNHLIKLENHNDYSDVSIESDRADGKKVTFDFGKSYCQIYEVDNSPDDSEMLDSMSALRSEGGQVFTPVDNPLYLSFHERNKLRMNSFDDQHVLDDDKSRIFFSYGVQPSPPPIHNARDNVFKMPASMDVAFLSCMDGLNIHVGQHYKPPTSVQIIELSDEENVEHRKDNVYENTEELGNNATTHSPEQDVIYSNLVDETGINQKPTVEGSTFSHYKNEGGLNDNLQPKRENKANDYNHERNVTLKSGNQLYQRDSSDENTSETDIHDLERSVDTAYQNPEEFAPIYGNICKSNNNSKNNNDEENINQKPSVEDLTLIHDEKESYLQPKRESEIEDRNHEHIALVEPANEEYERDSTKDNLSENNTHDPGDAVYQNLEEFQPIYGNISKSKKKSEKNNEEEEEISHKPAVESSMFIHYKNENDLKDDLQSKKGNVSEDNNHEHVNGGYQRQSNKENISENIHDSEHSDDLVYENLKEFGPIYGNICANIYTDPLESQSQSLRNSADSDMLNDSINLIELNNSSIQSSKSPQVECIAEADAKNNSDLLNFDSDRCKENGNSQSENSNQKSDRSPDKSLVHTDTLDEHKPSTNPFGNFSNNEEHVDDPQASVNISTHALNETLLYNSVGRRVDIDNTLSSIEESLNETEKSSISTSDSLDDYANLKTQRPKTFNNPLSRALTPPASQVSSKNNELKDDSNEDTSTRITEKPRVSYTSLVVKIKSPTVNTLNRRSAEITTTYSDLDARNSNENLCNPLSRSTSELLKDKVDNSNRIEEIRYPKRINVLSNSSSRSSENLASAKIFQRKPIIKPRTARRHGDDSEAKSEENLHQNEGISSDTMHKDDSKKKIIPIFKPRSKRNVNRSYDDGSSPTYSNVSQKKNEETLSEIKRRLSDVRNIETVSKQLEAIQDILLSLKRRVDTLESRTDDEYVLLLQTFFKSIRIVSGLECNFDQDLLDTQQKTLQDIQNCMKELNMK